MGKTRSLEAEVIGTVASQTAGAASGFVPRDGEICLGFMEGNVWLGVLGAYRGKEEPAPVSAETCHEIARRHESKDPAELFRRLARKGAVMMEQGTHHHKGCVPLSEGLVVSQRGPHGSGKKQIWPLGMDESSPRADAVLPPVSDTQEPPAAIEASTGPMVLSPALMTCYLLILEHARRTGNESVLARDVEAPMLEAGIRSGSGWAIYELVKKGLLRRVGGNLRDRNNPSRYAPVRASVSSIDGRAYDPLLGTDETSSVGFASDVTTAVGSQDAEPPTDDAAQAVRTTGETDLSTARRVVGGRLLEIEGRIASLLQPHRAWTDACNRVAEDIVGLETALAARRSELALLLSENRVAPDTTELEFRASVLRNALQELQAHSE